MRSTPWLQQVVWLGLLALAAIACRPALADDKEEHEERIEIEIQSPEGKTPAPAAQAGHKYWLRLQAAPLSPELREQLQLKDQGVLVEKITPDGPAEKAGIKPYDIVLAVGDKSVNSVQQLAEAIDATEGKPMTLKLLRAGQPTTVELSAEKRPEQAPPRGILPPELADIPELREVEKTIRESIEKLKEGANLRMQFLKPGRIVSENEDVLINLNVDFPDDLTVDIHKQGKQPTQIEVKQGDKTWKVTANDLNELPEEARKCVESLLGQHPLRLKILADHHAVPAAPATPHQPAPRARRPVRGVPPTEATPPVAPVAPEAPSAEESRYTPQARRPRQSLDRRLDELTRRVRETLEQIEELRNEREGE